MNSQVVKEQELGPQGARADEEKCPHIFIPHNNLSPIDNRLQMKE